MKIEQITVQQVKISELSNLDSIDVLLEDYGPRSGGITIRCGSNTWRARWNSMGNCTIAKFFCDCDEHYLAKNFSNTPGRIFAPEKVIENGTVELNKRLANYLKERRAGWLLKDEARVEFDKDKAALKNLKIAKIGDDPWMNAVIMGEVYGEEWWHNMPTKPNPDYQYLCRVIQTVQDALKSLRPALTEEDAEGEEESAAPAPGR